MLQLLVLTMSNSTPHAMEGCVQRRCWEQVEYVRGHWQRPTWQGRFAGGSSSSTPEDGLVIAWLMLERVPPPGSSPAPAPDEGVRHSICSRKAGVGTALQTSVLVVDPHNSQRRSPARWGAVAHDVNIRLLLLVRVCCTQ